MREALRRARSGLTQILTGVEILSKWLEKTRWKKSMTAKPLRVGAMEGSGDALAN